ncbi:unnamed protein product [Sphacelaria rigidula]
MSSHLPWVEKYRPTTISDVRGHPNIMSVLKKFRGISGIPHLLFFGPPGTGKTSTILAMAKEYYGNALRLMVMEVNASDERGIEVVTGKILSFVQAHSFCDLRVKLVILDEADALTVDAQSALRRIMEKSSADVRFCLCCNYVSKISAPLQSRCTKLRFEGIDSDSLRDMVSRIGENEGLPFAEGAVDAVLDLSGGDARRVINLLQSASLLGCVDSKFVLTAECFYKLAGRPVPTDIDDFLSVLSERSFKESFDSITLRVNEKGYAVVDIVSALAPKVLEAFAHDQARLGILLDELSNIEYNLSAGGSDKLAVGHLVSAFHMGL